MTRAPKTENRIRVLIVDDHSLFREMLFHTLSDEDDIEVVGQAVDGRDAIELTEKTRPDIILLDISMPRMDGIEATKILSERFPSLKIVILTAIEDDDYLFKLIRAGAIGYLMKDTSTDDVVNAVRAAYSGESLIQPKIARKVLRKLSGLLDEEKAPTKESSSKIEQLTDREKEVLILVGRGLNNHEIAEKLFISHATVKTHVMNAMHKLDLRDRVEMALFAVQSGLVSLE